MQKLVVISLGRTPCHLTGRGTTGSAPARSDKKGTGARKKQTSEPPHLHLISDG
ncbi:MAG: hypothetical protein ACFNM6_07070 [Prevotella sp.]